MLVLTTVRLEVVHTMIIRSSVAFAPVEGVVAFVEVSILAFLAVSVVFVQRVHLGLPPCGCGSQ
jgi:hypothetical protein